MIPLQIALTVLCLLCALWLVVLLVRDRTPGRVLLNMLAGVEVGVILNLVLGVIRVTGAHRGVPVAEYLGYLVGALLIVPAGVIWSAGEKTRGGTAALLVAVLLVPFMFVRLSDIWSVHG